MIAVRAGQAPGKRGTGQAAATYTYDAYGNQTGKTGSAATPLTYAGQFADTETGMQYLRARYYDPATTQFVTTDPLNAVSEQAYAYAGDNPINSVDPSGQLCLGGYCLGFHPVAALEGDANFVAAGVAAGGAANLASRFAPRSSGASGSRRSWLPSSAGRSGRPQRDTYTVRRPRPRAQREARAPALPATSREHS